MAVPTTPTITNPADGAVVSGVITVQWTASELPDTVAPAFIASTAQAFAPTVEAGVAPNTVAPSFIASGAQVFAPTVTAGSGVTVYMESTFNVTGTPLITDYAPESGGPWVMVGTQNGRVFENRARGGAGATGTFHFTDEPAGPDYDTPITIHRKGATALEFYIFFRWASTSNGYRLTVSDTELKFSKVVSGSLSALSTPGTAYTHGLIAGQDFSGIIRVQGTSIKLLSADGATTLIDAADSSLAGTAGSNKVGFATAASDTDGFHLDDIKAQSIT